MLYWNTPSSSISNFILYPHSAFGREIIFVLGSIRFNRESIDSIFLHVFGWSINGTSTWIFVWSGSLNPLGLLLVYSNNVDAFGSFVVKLPFMTPGNILWCIIGSSVGVVLEKPIKNYRCPRWDICRLATVHSLCIADWLALGKLVGSCAPPHEAV